MTKASQFVKDALFFLRHRRRRHVFPEDMDPSVWGEGVLKAREFKLTLPKPGLSWYGAGDVYHKRAGEDIEPTGEVSP